MADVKHRKTRMGFGRSVAACAVAAAMALQPSVGGLASVSQADALERIDHNYGNHGDGFDSRGFLTSWETLVEKVKAGGEQRYDLGQYGFGIPAHTDPVVLQPSMKLSLAKVDSSGAPFAPDFTADVVEDYSAPTAFKLGSASQLMLSNVEFTQLRRGDHGYSPTVWDEAETIVTAEKDAVVGFEGSSAPGSVSSLQRGGELVLSHLEGSPADTLMHYRVIPLTDEPTFLKLDKLTFRDPSVLKLDLFGNTGGEKADESYDLYVYNSYIPMKKAGTALDLSSAARTDVVGGIEASLLGGSYDSAVKLGADGLALGAARNGAAGRVTNHLDLRQLAGEYRTAAVAGGSIDASTDGSYVRNVSAVDSASPLFSGTALNLDGTYAFLAQPKGRFFANGAKATLKNVRVEIWEGKDLTQAELLNMPSRKADRVWDFKGDQVGTLAESGSDLLQGSFVASASADSSEGAAGRAIEPGSLRYVRVTPVSRFADPGESTFTTDLYEKGGYYAKFIGELELNRAKDCRDPQAQKQTFSYQGAYLMLENSSDAFKFVLPRLTAYQPGMTLHDALADAELATLTAKFDQIGVEESVAKQMMDVPMQLLTTLRTVNELNGNALLSNSDLDQIRSNIIEGVLGDALGAACANGVYDEEERVPVKERTYEEIVNTFKDEDTYIQEHLIPNNPRVEEFFEKNPCVADEGFSDKYMAMIFAESRPKLRAIALTTSLDELEKYRKEAHGVAEESQKMVNGLVDASEAVAKTYDEVVAYIKDNASKMPEGLADQLLVQAKNIKDSSECGLTGTILTYRAPELPGTRDHIIEELEKLKVKVEEGKQEQDKAKEAEEKAKVEDAKKKAYEELEKIVEEAKKKLEVDGVDPSERDKAIQEIEQLAKKTRDEIDQAATVETVPSLTPLAEETEKLVDNALRDPMEYGTHTPYIKGYPDGTFRPYGTATRAEIAAMLARILDLNIEGAEPQNFPDLNQKAWYAKYVNACVKAGVMKGDAAGTFRPMASVNRAEMVTILFRLKGSHPVADAPNPFIDVKKSDWAYEAIVSMAAQGVAKGYELPDGKLDFRPWVAVTRAETVTFMNRHLHRLTNHEGVEKWLDDPKFVRFSDIKARDWFYYEVLEAAENHDFKRPNIETPETWTKLN